MVIKNKKAEFNYQLLERLEAGISLVGSEAKALRTSGADITNSYIKIVGGEAFLINANIPIPGKKEYDATRTRKLLLHKDEIVSISTKIKQKKLTLVPTKIYSKGRLIKLEIALAKPKKKFEKKENLKRRDIQREAEKEVREKL